MVIEPIAFYPRYSVILTFFYTCPKFGTSPFYSILMCCFVVVVVVVVVCCFFNGPRQAKKCLRTCAKSADSDHPVHAQNCIRAFALHSYIL